MKNYVSICCLLLLIGQNIFSQESNFCENLISVNQLIQENHYAPKVVDDSLAVYVFYTYIDKLDEDQLIFTQTELDSLKKHRLLIDNYILNKDCSFIAAFQKTYINSLNTSRDILNSMNIIDLDFSGRDTIYYTSDKYTFAKNYNEKQKLWQQKIEREAIYHFLDKADSTSVFEKSVSDYAALAIKNELCKIDEKLLDSNLNKNLEDTFLDVFCSYFDPHTNYFNNSDKSYFDESLRDDYLSLGIYFNKTDQGIITISDIKPGSAAWKEKTVAIGDEILNITANGQTINMDCISLENLYTFIYNPAFLTFDIEFRKKETNTIGQLTLTKQKIPVNENTITSYIITGSQKIGYIKLPSFYTSESFGGGCANDIARELLSLKPQGIEGLILDLRDNGGGSLQEATDLVGLFIDRGPVAIIKTSNNHKEVKKDYNRGVIFSKPMVVLVNESSASASEYVTAALQDHKRAYVVGYPTFGKGSGQSVFPVNQERPEDGFVKITIEKLYRITGGTWQKDGVIPDFPLPNVLKGFGYRENGFDNVLASDSVVKNIHFKLPKPTKNETLKKLSSARLESNEKTKLSETLNEDIQYYFDTHKTTPLTLTSIKERKDFFDTVWKKIENFNNNHTYYSIENTALDAKLYKTAKEAAVLDNEKKNKLAKDSELLESYFIMLDILAAYK